MAEQKIPTFKILKESFYICKNASKTNRKWLWYGLIFAGISASIDAMFPVLEGWVLELLKNALPSQVLNTILIIWTVLFVCTSSLDGWLKSVYNTIETITYERYGDASYLAKLKSVLSMPALSLNAKEIQKIATATERASHYSVEILYQLLRETTQICRFLISIIILTTLSPLLCVLSIILLMLNIVFSDWLERHMKNETEGIEELRQRYSTTRRDTLDNTENIRVLGIQRTVLSQLNKMNEKYHTMYAKAEMHRRVWGGIQFILNGLVRLFVVVGAIHTALQTQNIGTYIMVTGSFAGIMGSMNSILNIWTYFRRNIIVYMKASQELEYNAQLQVPFGTRKITGKGEIKLKDITFSYPLSKTPVFQGLNLTIKPASCTAIIGVSGAGKSTLINVLQHAYMAQKGIVEINGVNLNNVSERALHECLSYIGQSPVFWQQKNIRENLLMFKQNATEAEIESAIKLANLWNELDKKERGIESDVATLSTGQKQRLSLARVFLRKTPIIVLDEPTANLDTVAQNKVLVSLKNLTLEKNKPTIVFASNVPAEIAIADNIVLLDNGKIVEQGATTDLMHNQQSQTYQRLKKYHALFS